MLFSKSDITSETAVFAGNASPRARILLVMAAIAAVLAAGLPWGPTTLVLTAIAVTLFFLSGVVFVLSRQRRSREGLQIDTIACVIENDSVPSFVIASDGAIRAANPAAVAQFDAGSIQTLAGVLKDSFANPTGVLFRLQSRAVAGSNASEEVVTRTGQIRLSVHRVEEDTLIWRVESIAAQIAPRAVQEAQGLPMLMVGRSDAILFMNEPARQLIGSRVKSLDRIFTDLSVKSGQCCDISTAQGTRRVLMVEIEAGAGRRAIYFLPPPDIEGAPQRWQAFHDLPVPMIKVAPDGSVQAFNKMAGKLVGVALREDAHLSDLMEGLGRSISDWLTDTLADRMVQKSEFLRLKRGDLEVFVQVVLSRITEDGEPALIAVMHDATELKSLEAKFVQSQKMQAIGQLAGGVAHDFNNLLTAIAGHCDLLLLRHDQGDPDYADLMQINQNANRAAALVGQLLAFSRKQTLRPETLDMRDTLSDLTHLLNRLVGEKVTLTLCHDPILKPIRADKRQLEQVLMNLVVNARDAMPEGGEIRIVTECVTLSAPLTRDRACGRLPYCTGQR